MDLFVIKNEKININCRGALINKANARSARSHSVGTSSEVFRDAIAFRDKRWRASFYLVLPSFLSHGSFFFRRSSQK